MDADLQHPPERISDLIREWKDGNDVVYFYKASRRREGLGKSAGAGVFYRLVNFGARVAIQHGGTGKGKLVIQYNSLDELDGIIAHIK